MIPSRLSNLTTDDFQITPRPGSYNQNFLLTAWNLYKTGRLAALHLAFDGFQRINDSLGLELGEVLLQEITARLAGVLPTTAVLHHQVNAEFVILLAYSNGRDEVLAVAEKVFEAFMRPCLVDEYELYMSANTGISFSPAHPETLGEPLWKAETAMHRAREAGKNTFRVDWASEIDHYLYGTFKRNLK